MRGALKTIARALVETTYGFETSDKPRTIERNRKLVLSLKDGSAFVYRKRGETTQDHIGLYENKIIQKVVNQMWFKSKHDDGVTFVEYYHPFPAVALALVLTAIECAIDEWASGSLVKIKFEIDVYRDVYNRHLDAIYDFEEASRSQGIMVHLLTRLHDNGRIHSKADPLEQPVQRAVSPSAFRRAIREYQDRNGRLSDSEEEDGEN
ncbi:hypothetical protein PLICRDRAFT_138729 [Plicaturopsis crispa FD-325 SS-3]|nr:hypothetical protein PLICRDRAFT_138729 [Plicaturopsis crispa FD-325 SS-3]